MSNITNDEMVKCYEKMLEKRRRAVISTRKFLSKNRVLVNERRRAAHLKKRQDELRRKEEIEQMKKEDVDASPNDSGIIIDINYIKDELKNLKLNGNIKTANTLKKYVDDAGRLMSITGCEDLKKCLLKHGEIIEGIENSTMKNGRAYSLNTKKGIYQTIIYLLDNIRALKNFNKKVRQIYFTNWEIYKIKSADENEERVMNNTTTDYNVYMNMVKNKYGIGSKHFLVVSIYNEIPARDDFGKLRIVNMTKENMKKKYPGENVLFYHKKNNLKLQMNKFKTFKEGKEINVELTKELSDLIREYTKNNNLNENNTLFNEPKGRLGDFMKKVNKDLGINDKGGAINFLRHSKITTIRNMDGVSVQDRLELSRRSGHAPNIQDKYIRLLESI